MHQTRKNESWEFGMMQRGTDDALGLVHNVHTTPANQANIDAAPRLLHGDQRTEWTDAGCQGLD
jgi:IS5 family transposase